MLTVPPMASEPYSAKPGPLTTQCPGLRMFTSYSALWLKNPVARIGMPSSRLQVERAGGERLADRRAVAFTIGHGNRHAGHLPQNLLRMHRAGALDILRADDANRRRRLQQQGPFPAARDGDHTQCGGLCHSLRQRGRLRLGGRRKNKTNRYGKCQVQAPRRYDFSAWEISESNQSNLRAALMKRATGAMNSIVQRKRAARVPARVRQ